MSDLSFYQNLRPISDLTQIDKDDQFRECPDDWVVVISDIRGSTKAVLDGRYRDVNVCGAAMIAMVQERLKTRGFPFVFGGDGATVLLPATIFEDLAPDFGRLIQKIHRDFKLDLRVGRVAYAELKALGAPIRVARLRISDTNYLATLKGPGVNLAEKLIKADAKYLLTAATGAEELSLAKLSCRFLPIPAKKDLVMSLLVVPDPAVDFAEFVKFLDGFRAYLLDPKFKPLDEKLDMDSLWSVYRKERKIDSGPGAWSIFLKVLILKGATFAVRLFKKSALAKTVRDYYADIPLNSDYQKFDGVLRMVIDCSFAEKAQILALLEEFKARKVIAFGYSESKSALMTCIVDDIHGGEHIHFIDGGDGGYTLAAKAMKNS